MHTVDYIIIIFYILGIVAAGMVFTSKMKNSKEMFAAGGKSPWWVSGLSAFMTIFSAGTFVIWGGIAYKYGVVAIAINLCYGVSALLVGWFLAGVWRKAGVDSASEFLHQRFGGSIVQFYTWFKGSLTLFSTGGAVYALSKIICALIPLSEGNLLADPASGHLSVPLTSVFICLVVIIIAFAGGLWAVLMTDVLQFVILTVSVVFVVPLILTEVGGWGAFAAAAPEGFFTPVAAEFSWWFLIGWMTVNFINFSGDWAFVQRWVCVPTVKDAKKSAFLIAGLYLASPIFWMIPPLVFRVINPNVDTEQAYILACQLVLPAGMVGLMVAAMASATASMATTRLNVYAGAFTEAYQRLFKQSASEKHLVFVGRIITITLGLTIVAGALLIPHYGYTKFIIDINTLLYVPLLLPTIWGLFSRKISLTTAWVTTAVGFVTAYIVKFALRGDGFLTGIEFLQSLVIWIAENSRIADMLAGILFPFLILTIIELLGKHEYPGWERTQKLKHKFHEQPAAEVDTLPGKLVAISLVVVALVIGLLSIINRGEALLLLTMSVVLLFIAGVFRHYLRKADQAVEG
ncbi:MAG: Na+:solute symporter [Opitutaceae bacterium]|nr:Na+:solute symporter [Opitutaceae bacterium]|tara:strand:+ start:20643 stop:22364 length:1722 start_codon:yes stop_codon:yes gene_type:complete